MAPLEMTMLSNRVSKVSGFAGSPVAVAVSNEGSVVAVGVLGTALVFPALANQCFTFNVQGATNIRCTSAGKAMLGIGWPLFMGGLMGVVITGIMFGVRKGKLRRLDDRIAYEKSRAVRWDPAGSRFVF
jgi:hypothetical protein